MNDTTHRRRRIWSAPILFIVLAITTGWGQAAPLAPQPASVSPVAASASLGRGADDIAFGSTHVDASFAGPQFLRPNPDRTFAAPKPTIVAKAPAAKPAATAPKPTSHTGINHLWIPALGISRPVYSFPCSRTRAPSNLVYRWGCAGHNNVYLLGHAYGVFKPLHDAYVSHRLHVGMLAYYANGSGHVTTFRVTTWRLVRPTNSSWAIASQPVPSMTLQTCVGAQSEWRLNVRLVAIN